MDGYNNSEVIVRTNIIKRAFQSGLERRKINSFTLQLMIIQQNKKMNKTSTQRTINDEKYKADDEQKIFVTMSTNELLKCVANKSYLFQ